MAPSFPNKSVQGIIDVCNSELPCIGSITDKSVQGIITKATAAGASIANKSVQGIIDQLTGFSCAPALVAGDSIWVGCIGEIGGGVVGDIYGAGPVHYLSGSGASSEAISSSGVLTVNGGVQANGTLPYAEYITYNTAKATCRVFVFSFYKYPIDNYYNLWKRELQSYNSTPIPGSGTLSFIKYKRNDLIPVSTQLKGIVPFAVDSGTLNSYYVSGGVTAPSRLVTTPAIPSDSAWIDGNMKVIHPSVPQSIRGMTALPADDTSRAFSSSTISILQSADPTGVTYVNSVAGDAKTWIETTTSISNQLSVIYIMGV